MFQVGLFITCPFTVSVPTRPARMYTHTTDVPTAWGVFASIWPLQMGSVTSELSEVSALYMSDVSAACLRVSWRIVRARIRHVITVATAVSKMPAATKLAWDSPPRHLKRAETRVGSRSSCKVLVIGRF
jgi:hypothetical protein